MIETLSHLTEDAFQEPFIETNLHRIEKII